MTGEDKYSVCFLLHLILLFFTWVVAGQACGAAKHLPEEGRVILPVLFKHLLQGLRPVQLIQHDGGWKSTHTRQKITNQSYLVFSLILQSDLDVPSVNVCLSVSVFCSNDRRIKPVCKKGHCGLSQTCGRTRISHSLGFTHTGPLSVSPHTQRDT